MRPQTRKWEGLILVCCFILAIHWIRILSSSQTNTVEDDSLRIFKNPPRRAISNPRGGLNDRQQNQMPEVLGNGENSSAHSNGNATGRVSVMFSSIYGFREGEDIRKLSQERWAVYSWSLFGSKLQQGKPPLILGLVDDEKYCDPWMQDNVLNFHCAALHCPPSEFDVPTIPCIYNEAAKYAEPGTIVAYINGDIVFPDKLADVVAASNKRFGGAFQLVGHRLNVDWPDWLPLTPENDMTRLQAYAEKTGVLNSGWGVDYFFFPAEYISDPFPPFYVGRWRWDNAMLMKMLLRNIPTVDATEAAKVIHFGIQGNWGYHIARSGAPFNHELALQEYKDFYLLGRMSNVPFAATWKNHTVSIVERVPRDNLLLNLLKKNPFFFPALKVLGGPEVIRKVQGAERQRAQ